MKEFIMKRTICYLNKAIRLISKAYLYVIDLMENKDVTVGEFNQYIVIKVKIMCIREFIEEVKKELEGVLQKKKKREYGNYKRNI